MQSFTRRIYIGEGFNPAFHFTKIYTTSGLRIHVSVIDMEDQSHAFYMELKGTEWKIVNAPKVSEWIMNAEKRLQEITFETMLD